MSRVFQLYTANLLISIVSTVSLFQTPSRMHRLTSRSSASRWECSSTFRVVIAFGVAACWAKPYIFFCNVLRFLLILIVAAGQSRQGIGYVLATRLVFNGVIKNLRQQYLAFNAGAGSQLLRVQTFQWLVISYKVRLDPI